MKHRFGAGAIELIAKVVRAHPPEEAYQFAVSSKAIHRLTTDVLSGVATSSDLDGPSCFERTIQLRRFLSNQDLWVDPARRVSLARWIVTDWGQVDKSADDDHDLVALIDAADSDHLKSEPFSIKRPASWTKYLAFRYPHQRAIFDARVAFTLNWLLMKSGESKFFPFPETANTLLRALDYRMWLAARMLGATYVRKVFDEEVQAGRVKSRAVSKCMKEIVIPSNYYQAYCDLLGSVGDKVFTDDPWAITKTEMVLFSIAPTTIAGDVLDAMSRIAGDSTDTRKPTGN